jgi:hypothetical protein
MALLGVETMAIRVTAFLAALASAAGIATAVNAAIVIDQSNLVPTSDDGRQLVVSEIKSRFAEGGDTYPGRPQVQTVTAGRAGLLTQVDLQVVQQGPADGNLILTLIDGDYVDIAHNPSGSPGGFGTVVGSVEIAVADLPTLADAYAGALTSFDVSGFGFDVAPGQVFSLLLEVTPPADFGDNAAFWVYAYHYLDDYSDFMPLVYPRGYNSATQFDDVFQPTAYDRSFRTWVDATSSAVPEPASWALMIGGFAIAGYAARRRRIAEEA